MYIKAQVIIFGDPGCLIIVDYFWLVKVKPASDVIGMPHSKGSRFNLDWPFNFLVFKVTDILVLGPEFFYVTAS